MTARMTVSVMNAATAILRPCDSLAAAMDGYSPERSGCDLLMQSAGLLIICHMREETTKPPTKFARDAFVEGRFIGRIHMIDSIVRTCNDAVKSAEVATAPGALWRHVRPAHTDPHAIFDADWPPSTGSP